MTVDYTDEDVNEMAEEELEWIEDDVSLDATTPEIEGFGLAIEDRPVKIKRAPKKVELVWEEYLQFLKQKPGTTARVFTFTGPDAATKARSRARSIRSRLVKTQPFDIWEITADLIKDDNSWRVYASYTRPATQEEIASRHAIHEARVARGHAVAEMRFSK